MIAEAAAFSNSAGYDIFIAMEVPKVRVTCAIIERKGRILATRRSQGGAMGGKWEFPGGKIENGETPEECLRREILEELGIPIDVRAALPPSPHRYPGFDIVLYPFVCGPAGGEEEIPALVLRDHSEVCWDIPENLAGLDWAGADIPVLAAYRKARQ